MATTREPISKLFRIIRKCRKWEEKGTKMLYYDARSKYDDALKNVGKRKKSKNDIFFSDGP